VLAVLFLFSSRCSGIYGQEEEVAGFNLQAYAPARILVSYDYTNMSRNILIFSFMS
jgi:hypothetical protein